MVLESVFVEMSGDMQEIVYWRMGQTNKRSKLTDAHFWRCNTWSSKVSLQKCLEVGDMQEIVHWQMGQTTKPLWLKLKYDDALRCNPPIKAEYIYNPPTKIHPQ